MNLILSYQEAFSLIQNSIDLENGFISVSIPDNKIIGNKPEALIFVFNESSKTISIGKKSCRLSPTQFALFYSVYNQGPIEFESLQDIVWKKPVSDGAIRRVISYINSKLINSEIPAEIIYHRGKAYIEKIS